MSDPCTEQHPLIDLEKFEKGLRSLCPGNQRDSDPLAHLLRIIGEKDESCKLSIEPKAAELSVEAQQDAREPVEWKRRVLKANVIRSEFAAIEAGLLGRKQPQAAILPDAEMAKAEYKRPDARVPLISGDFAAIEAGLLGALRDQATVTVPESGASNALPGVDPGSDRWFSQEKQPAYCDSRDTNGQIWSRRPLVVMAAIVLAGMAGIAVSFSPTSPVSGPAEVATIAAESESTKILRQTASGTDSPDRQATILSEQPEALSVAAAANNSEQPLDGPQGEEKAPSIVAQIESPQIPSSNGPATVPAVPVQTPTPVEQLSMASPTKPDNINPDLIQLESTPLTNRAPTQAEVLGAPVQAMPPAAKAKARPAKTVTPVAKTPKSAASTVAAKTGGHGQPQQITNNLAKAKPASSFNADPVLTADAKGEAPVAQPIPANNGPFGFVQTAMNSLTSTTAKLLEWGKQK